MTLPRNVTIRPAVLSDLDEIVALWMEMMQEHEQFDSRVRLAGNADEAYENYARYYVLRADADVLVAENKQEVIGFCLAYCARNLPMFRPGQYGFLSDVAVASAWRGKGVGTALVEETKQRFRRHGVRHIQLQVYHHNTAAREFWRKAGFNEFVHGLWFDMEE